MSSPEPQENAQPEDTALPPPLITFPSANVLVRLHHPSDAPAIQAAGDSPRIAYFMGRAFASPFPLALAHYLVGYANTITAPGRPDPLLCYAICDAATNTFIGTIGAKPRDDVESGTFVVGYWLGEKWWGRGIMTEVLRWYVKWVFDTFDGVRRLEGLVHEKNDGSKKVLVRAGFVYEGTRRKAGEKDGDVFGIETFGLLREECV